MAFDFDIEYIKGNSILLVDAKSRLGFYKVLKDKIEEFEDTFLHWVKTDDLSLDRMAAENIWGNCSRVERPYKEIRRKLTTEHGGICNGNLIIPPEIQRK